MQVLFLSASLQVENCLLVLSENLHSCRSVNWLCLTDAECRLQNAHFERVVLVNSMD